MEELVQLKEKMEEKSRLDVQLKKADEDFLRLKEKLEKLHLQLKKEFTDVQKLEGNGITSLFYSFLGNKIEKLDKEKQEYLSVKLKYENCKNEVEQLEIEINKIKSQILEIGNPDLHYNHILKTKSVKLKETGDTTFLKYESLLGSDFTQKKEINEAIDVGEMALHGLRNAIQTLRKAKNWGIYDMVGGGLLATAVKHSNIDEAKQMIYDVQVWLNKFKRELSDVHFNNVGSLTVQLDTFSTFADYFFDNLIFDWVVQSKINQSLEGCETMYRHVLDLVTQLRIADVDVTQKYKETKNLFADYIEKASV